MNLPKKYLELFFNILSETDLGLADARLRDSVVKSLQEPFKDYNLARKTIYETFCNKTEDGKPDIQDDKYHFSPDVTESVNKELITLLEEEVSIVVENPEKLKEILENTSYKPKVGEAEAIDVILTLIA